MIFQPIKLGTWLSYGCSPLSLFLAIGSLNPQIIWTLDSTRVFLKAIMAAEKLNEMKKKSFFSAYTCSRFKIVHTSYLLGAVKKDWN